MKKGLFFLFTLSLVMSVFVCRIWAEEKVTAVYFYSPSCVSCMSMSDFLEKASKSYKNLDVKKFDISNLKSKSLMDKYSEAYKVSVEDEGIVPVVFIRDKYFTDEKLIRNNFENVINNQGVKTIEIEGSAESHDKDLHRFEGFKVISVLLAGFVNGINPCSISMLLFFLSLLVVKNNRILKIGFTFISGKFLTYVLLGTILFKFLSLFNLSLLNFFMKVLLVIFTLIMIAMNIQDFFAAKRERYDRIFLQLPKAFRRFNHNIIKKATSFSDLKVMILISFLLGIFITLGEFLCTGQIYLATIITIFQTNTQLSVQALIFLIVYNLGLILPLVILTFLVYKGKEIFEVSEAIRERLGIIKILNAVIFLIFGVVILLYY